MKLKEVQRTVWSRRGVGSAAGRALVGPSPAHCQNLLPIMLQDSAVKINNH